jgi:outer membrane murein-binding lipoprotein Lpp
MPLFVCAQSYIVVVGGFHDYAGKECMSTCEYYDAASNKWQSFAELNVKRARAAAASLGNSLFVLGGCNNEQGVMDDVEEYTDVTNKWTVLKAHMIVGRHAFAAAVVSGRIYLVGGHSKDNSEQSSAEYYDAQQQHFESVTPMSTWRCEHAATSCQVRCDVEAMRKDGSSASSSSART